MHTMAKVKNAALADGDTPEPSARVIGEEQVVEAADLLVANTDDEAKQLVDLYDADPARVEVVHPGVDLDVFRPRLAGRGARAGSASPPDAVRAAVRRPDPAAQGARRAAARGRRAARRATRRCARGWSSPSSAGPSGTGLEHPESLAELAAALGIADVVRFVPPVAAGRAGRLVPRRRRWSCVPSYNESFGLVAVEAQASGTPVVAAAVGGLTTVGRATGVTGLLVDGHDPADYAARASSGSCSTPGLRDRAVAAARRARGRLRLGAHRRPRRSRSTDARPELDARRPRRRPVVMPQRHRADGPRRDASRRRSATPTSSGSETADGRVRRRRCPASRSCRPRCRLDVGAHALGVHAFVCRNPDENHERVYRWLLERNLQHVRRRLRRRPGSATSTSTAGCRWPRSPPRSSTGCSASVLTYADESFNTILELGLRHLDPQGVGVARSRAASRPATSRRSAAGSSGARIPLRADPAPQVTGT